MIDFSLLIIRLFLGTIFIAHGLQKAFAFFGGQGISKFSDFLNTLGFNPPQFWAYLAAYTELAGGICIVVGILFRTSALFLLGLIVIAAYKVHIANGFFLQSGGFEYTFLIAGVCLSLLIAGPGKFSLSKKL